MLLKPGGIDIFYVDESNDRSLFAVKAVAVPFLRSVDGVWQITWPAHLAAAKEWRAELSRRLKIPATKELHGTKIAGGRGNYVYGNRQIPSREIVRYYKSILAGINFLPPESVITVTGTRGKEMYGHARLERVMYALFQRMRSQCVARNVNAMLFFDEGHPEYRTLYRKAMKYLPTGSAFGDPRNLPLDMFVRTGTLKTLSCVISHRSRTSLPSQRSLRFGVKWERLMIARWRRGYTRYSMHCRQGLKI